MAQEAEIRAQRAETRVQDTDIRIPVYVQGVLQRLEENGYQAWCVGGCVRDALLGKEPDDWDVTTDALPETTLALFGTSALPTGLKHGTVTVRTEGGHVEVTTFRVDGVYLDGRRPESVTFTPSLTEDLARRDFTVNAMAVSLNGTLADPFGGRADLRSGVLRCVGKAEQRFREDGLRIMRGLRFFAVLSLYPEPETAAALRSGRQLLERIAVERIQVELRKLLPGPMAGESLRRFPEVFGVFWPELLTMQGVEQRNPHHCYDVWEHTLHALEAAPPEEVLRLTMLLHDIGKPACLTVDGAGIAHFYRHAEVSAEMADRMLEHLRFDTETRLRVVQLVTWHDRDIWTRKSLRRALAALGEPALRNLIAVKRADSLAQHPAFRADRQAALDRAEALLEELVAQAGCFTLKELAVNGRDMMALGLQGRSVGRVLQTLLAQVVDEELPNSREVLLQAAGQMAADRASVSGDSVPSQLHAVPDESPAGGTRKGEGDPS